MARGIHYVYKATYDCGHFDQIVTACGMYYFAHLPTEQKIRWTKNEKEVTCRCCRGHMQGTRRDRYVYPTRRRTRRKRRFARRTA